MEGKPILVGGDLRVCVFASTVMVCEGVDCHVLGDAEDPTVQLQQFWQFGGILAGQSVHQVPPVGHIPVEADIVRSVLRGILAPPLLVDKIPWKSVQHGCQLIDMMVDGRINAQRGHADVIQILQVLEQNLPHLRELRREVGQGIHVAGRAIVVRAEPSSVGSHLAPGSHLVPSLVVEVAGIGCIPSFRALLHAVAIMAATPADTGHVIFRRPVALLGLHLPGVATRCGHVIHEDIHNDLDPSSSARSDHLPELGFSSRACVQPSGYGLILHPPLPTQNMLSHGRHLDSVKAIGGQILSALLRNILVVPLHKLHEDSRSHLFTMQAAHARLVAAEAAEDRRPVVPLTQAALCQTFRSCAGGRRPNVLVGKVAGAFASTVELHNRAQLHTLLFANA
mmetsp:Transcript_7461/g.17146  ORF Transcript_7461/g.17146 Transcript_7461/m.17146 type:complete len:395 (+) Transcript_7461:651-1835(+)